MEQPWSNYIATQVYLRYMSGITQLYVRYSSVLSKNGNRGFKGRFGAQVYRRRTVKVRLHAIAVPDFVMIVTACIMQLAHKVAN